MAIAAGASWSGRYRAWGVTWLAYATFYVGRKGLSVSKTSIHEQLGVSMWAFGAIDTAYLTAYAIGQFISGYYGDRVGARRLVGYGLLAVAIFVALFGSVGSAVLFGTLFCLNGAAQSTGWPGTTRAMAEWTTASNRGRVMGFWATCYQVGGIVATVVATFLLVRFGWRAAFHGPAIWIGIVGVLVLLLLRPGPGASSSLRGSSKRDVLPTAGGSLRESDTAARKTAQCRLLRSPVLWCYGASYFCIKLIRYSLLFWLPTYLDKGLGYDKGTAGYVSIAFEVGGPIGVVVIGIASDHVRRFARSFLPAVGLVVLAVAMLLYSRVGGGSVVANVLLLGLVGFALFGPDSLISGAAAQDAGGPHAAATATGFVNGVGSMGAVLSSYATVWISEAFGWEKLFFVFLALSLLAAAALLPTIRRKPVPAVTATAGKPE